MVILPIPHICYKMKIVSSVLKFAASKGKFNEKLRCTPFKKFQRHFTRLVLFSVEKMFHFTPLRSLLLSIAKFLSYSKLLLQFTKNLIRTIWSEILSCMPWNTCYLRYLRNFLVNCRVPCGTFDIISPSSIILADVGQTVSSIFVFHLSWWSFKL